MRHNVLSVVCSNYISILEKLLDITICLMNQELTLQPITLNGETNRPPHDS